MSKSERDLFNAALTWTKTKLEQNSASVATPMPTLGDCKVGLRRRKIDSVFNFRGRAAEGSAASQCHLPCNFAGLLSD
jgi:hypothetical protein